MTRNDQFMIGWGQADITPPEPVLLRGQFHARVSEGVMDPITATVLVIEGSADGASREQAVFVSCDLVSTSAALNQTVRELVRDQLPSIDPEKIILSATHTHTAPATQSGQDWDGVGISLDELGVMSPEAYVKYCAQQIVQAIDRAWNDRRPGGISWGLGHAVIGHNRLWTNKDGKSTMYGNTDTAEFSHIEGYEDHSVGLIYTWSADAELTGIVATVPCPAQVIEHEFLISADFWHDTRMALKDRLGAHVYVLGQCAPAGDQSPHHIICKSAEERMRAIKGQTRRQEIAGKIIDAIEDLLPYMKAHIDWEGPFRHVVELVSLTRRLMREVDVEQAQAQSQAERERYESLLVQLEKNPRLRREKRWYKDITRAYALMRRHERVIERFELMKTSPTYFAEIHVLRLGELAIATNPFELYLDYGLQIQARSPAVQTILVQLTGTATGNGYIPTQRSIAHGGYGAVPASTIVGAEGGQELVDRTLEILNQLWQ